MTSHRWQKSSYCQEGDACVHISTAPGSPALVRIADADPPRSVLTVGATAFTALLDLVKSAMRSEPAGSSHARPTVQGVELP
ncbi:DUF397 domain-containing protein [Streptomyces sp. NPDC051987]|uniref:DUF397 domain-containing protein n=1 Tax=Streptomyces sp. NPDC051987 TaxID=3155808 RepID=UPI0034478D94